MGRIWRSQLARVLMERYSVTSPEEALLVLTQTLLEESDNSSPPINVEVLASFAGAIVHQRVMQNEGELRTGPRLATISVKASDLPRRRRSTACHEVIHCELARITREAIGYHPINPQRERDEEEELCHLGSAMLLVNPIKLASLLISRPRDFRTVNEMANYFDASLDVVCQQIARFNLWPVGFIDWRRRALSEAQRTRIAPAALKADDGGVRWRVNRFFASSELGFVIPIGYGSGTRQLEDLYRGTVKTSRQERRFTLSSGRITVIQEAWYVPFGTGADREERILAIVRTPSFPQPVRWTVTLNE